MSEESAAYDELQRVLDDPEFWFGDCFMEGEKLVGALSESDWNRIVPIAWASDGDRWERFTACADAVRSRSALALSMRLLTSQEFEKTQRGLTLLQCLHREMGGDIGSVETERLAEAWRRHVQLRSPLAQAAWRLGKSRLLREAVGVASWTELAARPADP